MKIEGLGCFAAVTGSEAEFGAVFAFGPAEHSVPEFSANALAADFFVGDEIFKIGNFSDDGAHDDGKGGDADDLVVVIIGE